MSVSSLDNPIWEALASRHGRFAQGQQSVARYPREVAPFLGVATPETPIAAAIETLVEPQETVYLLGVAPTQPDGWRLQHQAQLAQMVCMQPLREVEGPSLLALGADHHADVLALTALVYPHYFRPRAVELGRYFGIYRDGQLAAMIGERMATDTATEISAVCTHPDFNGRGHARRLLAWLSNDLLRQGRTPFLHVSHENERARTLYKRCGYQHRRDIPFWSLQRG